MNLRRLKKDNNTIDGSASAAFDKRYIVGHPESEFTVKS